MVDDASDNTSRTWLIVLRTIARVLASIVVLVGAYYLVPLDGPLDGSLLLSLGLALVLLTAIGVFETRAILRAPLPGVKAVEALTVLVPLLVLIFAASYYLMSESDPSVFTESLTRTDALYFTLTVFSTVGFGDITPVSQQARAVVSFQVVVNLVVVGLGVRIIVGAAKRGRENH